MTISALSSSIMVQYSLSYSLAQTIQRDESTMVPEATGTSNPDTAPLIEAADTSDEAESQQKLRGENGVLRLLQEGHFKGNAEMRLREVFRRELSILGLAEESPAASDLVDETPESVV